MCCATPSLIFSATFPMNPSHTITSTFAGKNFAALDVAHEMMRQLFQPVVCFAHQFVALRFFLADAEQPYAGPARPKIAR